MTKSSSQSLSATKPAVIVYGLDQAGKPKAGRFAERHAAAAKKAAKALKLAVLAINRPEVVDLVTKIPVGRIHAQGKAFIPYIKRELFDRLQAANGPSASKAAASKPGPAVSQAPVAKPPKDWDSIGEGHLVLYQEGGPRDAFGKRSSSPVTAKV